MNYPEPINGNILVKFQLRSHEMASDAKRIGIELVDPKYQGAPNQGEVLAVPSDLEEDIQVGDYIYYDDDNPQGFVWNQEKVIIVHISKVAGKRDD